MHEKALQRLERRRLDQMFVAPGLKGLAAIVFLAVAGQRHQEDVIECGIVPKGAGDGIAVHSRQSDIQKNDFGTGLSGLLQSLVPIMRQGDLVMAELSEETTQQSRRTDVVIDGEDPQGTSLDDGSRC